MEAIKKFMESVLQGWASSLVIALVTSIGVAVSGWLDNLHISIAISLGLVAGASALMIFRFFSITYIERKNIASSKDPEQVRAKLRGWVDERGHYMSTQVDQGRRGEKSIGLSLKHKKNVQHEIFISIDEDHIGAEVRTIFSRMTNPQINAIAIELLRKGTQFDWANNFAELIMVEVRDTERVTRTDFFDLIANVVSAAKLAQGAYEMNAPTENQGQKPPDRKPYPY